MKRTCRVIDGKTVWEPPFTEAEDRAHQERLQEMFHTGQTPFLMTDSVYLEGTENGRQFAGHEDVGDRLKELAAEQGVDVKGKVYKSSLARFPSDGRAWVSSRAEAQKLFDEHWAPRGYSAEGAIKGKGRNDVEPPKRPRLAADIADRLVEKELESHPEPHRVDVQELREKVTEKHGKD